MIVSTDTAATATLRRPMVRRIGSSFPSNARLSQSLPSQTPDARRKIFTSKIETLAKLHVFDPEKIGLGDFGKPGNYFERQIGRWSRQYLGDIEAGVYDNTVVGDVVSRNPSFEVAAQFGEQLAGRLDALDVLHSAAGRRRSGHDVRAGSHARRLCRWRPIQRWE